MALLMFPDPNQWPAVVSPCSDVVAWQPWWQVLHTCGRLQKSVSIWLRGNRTSYLFSKSHQIFASKQQILPHLCIERAIIRYNLTARILLSSSQGQKGLFFFATFTYNCFILSPHIPLFLHSFLLLTCTFFTLLSHPYSPLFLPALTLLTKYLIR